jgi:hypothetical protein
MAYARRPELRPPGFVEAGRPAARNGTPMRAVVTAVAYRNF